MLLDAPPDAAPPPPPEALGDAGPVAPVPLEWSILIGAGAITPTPATVSPWLSLEGDLLIARRWQVALLAAVSLGGTTPVIESAVTRGELATRDLLALPGFAVCSDTLLRACLGVLAGLRLTLGSAAGSLVFQTKTQVFPEFTGGARVEVALPVSWARLSAGVGVLFNPVPTQFGLEGLKATVSTPLIEGFAHLRVGLGPSEQKF
jgi:hypothetical protein